MAADHSKGFIDDSDPISWNCDQCLQSVVGLGYQTSKIASSTGLGQILGGILAYGSGG